MATTNPYRYAGYRWDNAIGMYYLNARYYDPATMRFISEDPLNEINAYAYAGDNPQKYVDPTGLLEDEQLQHGGGGSGNFDPEEDAIPSGEESDTQLVYGPSMPDEFQILNEDTQAAQRTREIESRGSSGPTTTSSSEGTDEASSSMEMKDLNDHYEKHVVKRQEFGDISKEEYLRRANSFVKQRPGGNIQQASRIRDRTTITLDTSSNEIGFVSDGKIQTYYRVNMNNLPQFKSPLEYFYFALK